MAQSNNPFGLQPVKPFGNAPYSGAVQRVLITASDGNNMGIGDPVVLYGDANTAGTVPTVTLASAGKTHPILGVITSFELNPDSLYTVYRKASVAAYANIVIATPDMLFEVQAGATVLPYTTVGLNAELKAGSVNTYTGLSGWYMDSGDTTAPDVDATGQLTILGFSTKPGNDITAAYGVWRVRINLCQLANAVAGV